MAYTNLQYFAPRILTCSETNARPTRNKNKIEGTFSINMSQTTRQCKVKFTSIGIFKIKIWNINLQNYICSLKRRVLIHVAPLILMFSLHGEGGGGQAEGHVKAILSGNNQKPPGFNETNLATLENP